MLGSHLFWADDVPTLPSCATMSSLFLTYYAPGTAGFLSHFWKPSLSIVELLLFLRSRSGLDAFGGSCCLHSHERLEIC